MFIIKGTLSALRNCPECSLPLNRFEDKDLQCPCGYVWLAKENESQIGQLSSSILGQSKA